MKLGYQTNTWGGVIGAPAGVTSIKDLYYRSNGSTEQAVAEIASIGYDGVELFDGNLLDCGGDPHRLRRLLDEHEQSLVGVYCGGNFVFGDVLEEELWRIENAARMAGEIGAEQLVVGGGAVRVGGPTDDDYGRLADGLDRVVQIARRHRLTASFHPHLGSLAESPEQIARVLAHSEIGFCPDTGHLIASGGDPAALIRQYGARIPYVHLKDVTVEGRFVPLGRGALDLDGVLDALGEQGYDGWIVVELDEWEDPKAGAAESYRRLGNARVTAGDRG